MNVDINSMIFDLFHAGFSIKKSKYADCVSIEVLTGCTEHKIEITIIGKDILVRHSLFPVRDYILDHKDYLKDFCDKESKIFNECLNSEYKSIDTDSFQDACQEFKIIEYML